MHAFIITVPERHELATRLQATLEADNITTELVGNGIKRPAIVNHRDAISFAYIRSTTYDRSIIIEDDAILTSNFHKKLDTVLETERDTPLLSLYLGKQTPVKAQDTIKKALDEQPDASTLHFPHLWNAVAYTIQPGYLKQNGIALIDEINARIAYNRGPYTIPTDTTIEEALNLTDYAYTIPSLVNHNTDVPGVYIHSGLRLAGRREAWRFDD